MNVAGALVRKHWHFCASCVHRNLCGIVNLKHFRVKSSGWKSCGGRWKRSATNSIRRFRISAMRMVAAQKTPPLTQGLTPRHRHPQTLCSSQASTLSQTLPPAPSPAMALQKRTQAPYSKGPQLHPHRNKATWLTVPRPPHASSIKPPACKPLFLC